MIKENRTKAVNDLIINDEYESYDKKDITIFFSMDKETRKIEDIVVEHTPQNSEEGNRMYSRYKQKFSFDIGNSLAVWDEFYNLSMILIILYQDYGFHNKKTGEKAIMELFKVKEFKQDLAPLITGAFNSMIDFSDYGD